MHDRRYEIGRLGPTQRLVSCTGVVLMRRLIEDGVIVSSGVGLFNFLLCNCVFINYGSVRVNEVRHFYIAASTQKFIEICSSKKSTYKHYHKCH